MPDRKMLDCTCAIITVVLGLVLTGVVLYAASLADATRVPRPVFAGYQTAVPEFWNLAAVVDGLKLWDFSVLPLIILCTISVIIAVACLAFTSWIITPFCTAIANGLEISRNRRAHHSAIRIRRQNRLQHARAQPNA